MIEPMAAAIRAATIEQVHKVADALAHAIAEGGPRAVVWHALREALMHQEHDRLSYLRPHSASVKAVAAMNSDELARWLRELAELANRTDQPGERGLIMSLYYELLGADMEIDWHQRRLDEDVQRLTEGGPA